MSGMTARRINHCMNVIRMQATSSHSSDISHTSATESVSPVRRRLDRWLDSYEDFIGVKAVKEAQANVMEWEKQLSEAQMLRREKQAELKSLQARMKEIHFDLDRTSRGEDKYLALLTEEHATIKKERSLAEKFETFENSEREAFHQLSMKVRESHEKERERVEKTKWWGVTASVTGALIGIVGSTINNELRMRRLKELVPASSDDLKMLLDTIREENGRLAEQISKLSSKIQIDKAITDPQAVVYVGSDMERLLDQTERNLESKMKLQTLLSVVVLYSAVAFTVPLLWAVFKGG